MIILVTEVERKPNVSGEYEKTKTHVKHRIIMKPKNSGKAPDAFIKSPLTKYMFFF
jgi:hypothetical protein